MSKFFAFGLLLVSLAMSLGFAYFVFVWALAEKADLYSETIGWVLFGIGAFTVLGYTVASLYELWTEGEFS